MIKKTIETIKKALSLKRPFCIKLPDYLINLPVITRPDSAVIFST